MPRSLTFDSFSCYRSVRLWPRSVWTDRPSWGVWRRRRRRRTTDRTRSRGTRTAEWWLAGHNVTSSGSFRSAGPTAAFISVWCAGATGRRHRVRPPCGSAVSGIHDFRIYRLLLIFDTNTCARVGDGLRNTRNRSNLVFSIRKRRFFRAYVLPRVVSICIRTKWTGNVYIFIWSRLYELALLIRCT